MSSGEKQLVFNTRERALSTDFDRAQAFVACDRSQLARFFYNDQRQNTYVYPGVSKQYVGGEAPMAADVFGGLMVDPQTTSVLITPGEIGCLFPDPSITADDSPYMLINDPGQQTAGILTFTANASGQTRVDLIECQPVSTILETDNRDIFNPGTGLFAPASVTKVQAFRLQYRIRTGTGGAGVPALAAGWLPLAAIVMPSGAADYNACDFYDVRPLVEERVRPQPAYIAGAFQSAQYSPVRDAEYSSRVLSGATVLQGYSENQFGGYIAGGWLRRSTPNSSGAMGGTGVNDGDAVHVNLSLVDNQTPGFAPTANQLVYLVAFFPAALPRWVRYAETPVGGGFGRIPRGPRGILLATTSPPFTNGIVFPLSIGHGLGTAGGVVLGAMYYNPGGTNFLRVNAQGSFHSSEKRAVSALTATAVAGVVSFALDPDVHYPVNATEIEVEFGLAFTNGGATDVVGVAIETGPTATPVYLVAKRPMTAIAGSSGGAITVRVPLLARPDPAGFGGTATVITLTASGSPTFNTGANLQIATVVGFRLGS